MRLLSQALEHEHAISFTHEPGEAEEAYFIAGATSVTLYGIFFLCCLWRTHKSIRVFKNSFENKKGIIHISLTLFGFFEMLYGVSHMVAKRDTVWGYIMHICGSFFVLVSFSLVRLG